MEAWYLKPNYWKTSLQSEFLYSTQDAKLSGLGTQVKNELGYLAVPVLAKFYLTKDGLSLEMGPQASLW
ncbi:hypothetical protein [Flavobacterium sp.]|uniref:hypothetical protein n=1 Tax=Flavobacterium sp. TaxID=239 RepID=UPI00334091A6